MSMRVTSLDEQGRPQKLPANHKRAPYNQYAHDFAKGGQFTLRQHNLTCAVLSVDLPLLSLFRLLESG